MFNYTNIAPEFSPPALELISQALLIAAKQKQPQALPSHLIMAINQSPIFESFISQFSFLPATEASLRVSSAESRDRDMNTKFLAGQSSPSPSSVSLNKVFIGLDLKKVIYQAYSQSLLENSQKVSPFHFILPLNSLLKKPLDTKKLKEFLSSVSSSPSSSSSSHPTLDQFTQNLTQKALTGKLDQVIGREQEVDQLIRVLARRSKSNAILVGDPGVGKTAIVEGLALKIAEGNVPDLLKPVSIYDLNLTTLLAGSSYQGELEERLESLINEVKKSGNVIIFIDEIHMIMGAGNAAGAMTAANILKPALARGDLNVIGATTQDEYRQHIEKDPALARRFEAITINEPSLDATLKILESVANKLTKHHGVTIDQPVLVSAIELSNRYIQDRFLPDKAIDLLDEATSGAKINGKTSISIEDLKTVISQKTGIPINSLSEKDSAQLLNLEDQLKEHLIGQDQAIKAVADVVKRSRAGLKDPNKPIGSFLLLGPTGIGKTELAKTLAKTVYQSEKAMVRLDMSEFMEAHTADKLIGAPPGYVGYEEGGQLTNPIRQHPYSLILLDELEKAHPKVFDIFLQVLEDGRLTDSKGHTVDFKNTIIIMTSNLDLSETLSDPHQASRNDIMNALSHHLRPEFVNRIDDIIIMNSLTLENIKKIAQLQLTKLIDRLKAKNITLTVPDDTLEELLKKGNLTEFGARPLKRLLQNHLEEPLAELLISGELKPGSSITWTKDRLK